MTVIHYRQSQIGWIMLALMVPVMVFLVLACWFQWGSRPLPVAACLPLIGLIGLIGLLFYRLEVSVDGQGICLRYGIGWIRIHLPIDQLMDVKVIRTPWYYGLGIRVTPKGMLYNIHGTQAVSVRYRVKGKEKHVMIGTPEPQRLKQVLEGQFSADSRTGRQSERMGE